MPLPLPQGEETWLQTVVRSGSCFETRLAARDERGQALADVGAQQRRRGLAFLDGEALVERAFTAVAREPLHGREATTAARADRAAIGERLGDERLGRDDVIDEAPLLRRLGVEPARRKEQIE